MRRRNLILATAILFAVVLTMSGCKIVYSEAELIEKIITSERELLINNFVFKIKTNIVDNKVTT